LKGENWRCWKPVLFQLCSKSIPSSEATVAIDLPHDAFFPWEKDAVYTLRKKDEGVGQEHVIQGTDEYRLMVEHFSDAILGRTELGRTPDESSADMRVLDALSEAAKTGNTVNLEYECYRKLIHS